MAEQPNVEELMRRVYEHVDKQERCDANGRLITVGTDLLSNLEYLFLDPSGLFSERRDSPHWAETELRRIRTSLLRIGAGDGLSDARLSALAELVFQIEAEDAAVAYRDPARRLDQRAPPSDRWGYGLRQDWIKHVDERLSLVRDRTERARRSILDLLSFMEDAIGMPLASSVHDALSRAVEVLDISALGDVQRVIEEFNRRQTANREVLRLYDFFMSTPPSVCNVSSPRALAADAEVRVAKILNHFFKWDLQYIERAERDKRIGCEVVRMAVARRSAPPSTPCE